MIALVESQQMLMIHLGVVGQVTELLSWAEKAKPWAEFGLALASIAVNVCTGLAIPAADIEAVFGTNAGGALSEFVNEALTSSTEAMATNAGEILEDGNTAERIHHAGACRLGRQKVKQLFGAFGLRLSAIL